MSELRLRMRRRFLFVTSILFLWAAMIFSWLVLIAWIPERWQFEQLPHWSQYSVLVLGIASVFGEMLTFIPGSSERTPREQADDFRCMHCGNTIHSAESKCSQCGWSWTA